MACASANHDQGGKIIMQVKVEQLESVKFFIHARHHTVICDQPAENGGNDEGMTPPEFLLASLGSCAAFYAAQYLKTRNLATDGVEVTVNAEKLKAPARLGNFTIEVHCPVPLTDEQQQGMVRSVHSCLVHNTLMSVPEIAIELKLPVLAG
jgi:putative redox protein